MIIPVAVRLASLSSAGDAEVAELHHPLCVEHEVLGLDVAVEQPSTVREVECCATGKDCGACFVGRKAFISELVAERPLAPLHDEQADAVVAVDEVVHRHDVRMVERGHHAGFGHEAFAHGWVGGKRPRELLDGDLAPQAGVSCPVDDAEGTSPQLAGHFVCGERFLQQQLFARGP